MKRVNFPYNGPCFPFAVEFLPYWLLSYEEIEALLLDRSDSNAPNQARALFDLIIEYKKEMPKI
jgi:hypothetical protein